MTATRGCVVFVAMLAGACAHRAVLSQQAVVDEDVVAQAVAWVIKAAPDARTYTVQVSGKSAGSSLLERVARSASLHRVGNQLRRPDAGAGVVEVVAVISTLPRWREQEANVGVNYSVAGATAVNCEVLVRRGQSSSEWLLRTPSDVACWPRPRAVR